MTGSVALFNVNALPNRRVEDWKYSDLRSALEGANDVAIVGAEWRAVRPPALSRRSRRGTP